MPGNHPGSAGSVPQIATSSSYVLEVRADAAAETYTALSELAQTESVPYVFCGIIELTVTAHELLVFLFILDYRCEALRDGMFECDGWRFITYSVKELVNLPFEVLTIKTDTDFDLLHKKIHHPFCDDVFYTLPYSTIHKEL